MNELTELYQNRLEEQELRLRVKRNLHKALRKEQRAYKEQQRAYKPSIKRTRINLKDETN